MLSRVEPSMHESVDQRSVGVADRAQRDRLLRGGGVFGEQQVQAVEVFAPVLVPYGLVGGSPAVLSARGADRPAAAGASG